MAEPAVPHRRRARSKQLKVRNKQGEMVPLGTLAHGAGRRRPGDGHALQHVHLGRRSTATRRRASAPAQAIEVDGRAGATSWTCRSSGPRSPTCRSRPATSAMLVFGLGTVLVFLVLAAKYESWKLPLAVILVVPMCLLCAVTGMLIARLPVDIFVQIGFLVLVGLAAKNAILIVEFAQQLQQRGQAAARGDGRGQPAASAADRHDVVRVHLRRGAAGARPRGRGGNAAVAGHGGVQRHDRRDVLRHLPDAGVLLRHPRSCPRANAGPRAGRRRDRWVVPRPARWRRPSPPWPHTGSTESGRAGGNGGEPRPAWPGVRPVEVIP